MLTRAEYIRMSLESHLFWARIMKEHLIFMEAGFVSKDVNLIQQAKLLKNASTALLADAVNLANGVVSADSIAAQEFVTNNTLPAEEKTQQLSGIPINTSITCAEMALRGNLGFVDVPGLARAVSSLNQRGIVLSAQIAEFKRLVRDSVLSCTLFTWNFPLLLDHIRREALMYNANLIKFQRGENPHDPVMAAQLEAFWNRLMEEHALFIRNYLDPTEEELFETAQAFAARFDELTEEAEAAAAGQDQINVITQRSLDATRSIRDFKKTGTEGILMCTIKGLIAPLLADHVTREANHYIRMLTKLQAGL